MRTLFYGSSIKRFILKYLAFITLGLAVYCLPAYSATQSPSMPKNLSAKGLRHVIAGGITSISVINPNTYIVGVATRYVGGVYKTTDGGKNWSPMNSGLSDNYVLSVHAVNANIYLAGTGGINLGGVFKSTNGGETWFPSDSGIKKDPFMGIHVYSVSAVDDNTYVAATNEGGAYKSLDGGETWTPINSGVTGIDVINTVLPIDANNYLALTIGHFYKSVNAGKSWFQGHISSDPMIDNVDDIYPIDKNTYLAEGTNSSAYPIIYRSTDGGIKWTPLPSSVEVSPIYIWAGTSKDSNIYLASSLKGGVDAGILFKSIDSGESWNRSDTGLSGDLINSLAIIDSNTYLAGNLSGMFKTVDGGKNWFPINSGLPFPQ